MNEAEYINEICALRARLAAVEVRLLAASVLEIDFKLRDRIIAVARGEGDSGGTTTANRLPHSPGWCEMGGVWACQGCLDRQREGESNEEGDQ